MRNIQIGLRNRPYAPHVMIDNQINTVDILGIKKISTTIYFMK